MTKLFVGGVPYSITTQQLEELFTKYGTVASAQIINDKYTGQSKGFAFIEMPNDSEAQKAIKELDGYSLDGRKLGVSVARPRPEYSNSRGFNANRNDSRRDNPRGRGNVFLRGSHRR